MALYAPKFKAQKRLHLPPLKNIGRSLYGVTAPIEIPPPPPPPPPPVTPTEQGLTIGYDFTQGSNIEEL